MSVVEIGDTVGAILKADTTTVYLIGYGVYKGLQTVPSGPMEGIPNPCIEMPGGVKVWGYQCWWASKEKVELMIGKRAIVNVSIPEL